MVVHGESWACALSESSKADPVLLFRRRVPRRLRRLLRETSRQVSFVLQTHKLKLTTQRPFLSYYGARFLLWELSTPLLNIHWSDQNGALCHIDFLLIFLPAPQVPCQ